MRFLPAFLLAALLAASSFAHAQEVAGRILAAVGDVTITRGAQRLPGAAGTPLQSGDTVAVGAGSTAQLRFTDESVFSLRPETTFRIAEYGFQGREAGLQRAFFDLVRGGLRTVTGAIGRDRSGYRMNTPLATVGIRGTGYSLLLCNDDCRNADGSIAPNGAYGAVTEGRIAVSNNAGEREFGMDQFFYVATAGSLPQLLLAPPTFLTAARVRPTAQQQAQAAQKASSGSAGAAAATTSVAAADPVPVAIDAAPTAITPVAFQVTNTPQPATLLSQQSFDGTSIFRIAGPFSLPITCNNPPCGALVAGEVALGVNYALGRVVIGLNVKADDGEVLVVGTPSVLSGIPVTVIGNTATFNVTLNLADFPQNQGAFRCGACGPGGTVGFFTSMTFTGSITGNVANLTFTGVSPTGTGSITTTLPVVTPPNNSVAAMVTQRAAGGSDARSYAFFNVTLDASGRLVRIGPPVGGPGGFVGSSNNNLVGTAPSAGNLAWGNWTGGGAQITDSLLQSYTSTAGQRQTWITGDAPGTLPTSLGSLTFAPVGQLFDGTSGRLNAASLTADFVNRTLSLSINATNTIANNTFQMNATTGFNPVNSRFSGGFNSVTCTGTCAGATLAGSYGGFFAGAQAQGAGVAFTAGFGQGTGVTGVIAFGR